VNKTRRSPLAGALALAFSTSVLSLASPVWAQDNGVTELDATDRSSSQKAEGIELGTVSVTGSRESGNTEGTNAYTRGSANTSTRMDLSLRETPQSVSVMTRTQMDDFNLNDINAVLDNTPGVKVERVETDRFYYTSRGFDITNFQIDGVGIRLPDGNVSGGIDTAIYDRVEVVRGANGLMAGAGNPSATVNLIRKRPTAHR
jgi:outer membrane receptor for ferric coprogen and ferric-rhodotorulic acid